MGLEPSTLVGVNLEHVLAISGFLESLARLHAVTNELAEGYNKAMGQDEKREQDALDWSEALIGDSQDRASHEAR